MKQSYHEWALDLYTSATISVLYIVSSLFLFLCGIIMFITWTLPDMLGIRIILVPVFIQIALYTTYLLQRYKNDN